MPKVFSKDVVNLLRVLNHQLHAYLGNEGGKRAKFKWVIVHPEKKKKEISTWVSNLTQKQIIIVYVS